MGVTIITLVIVGLLIAVVAVLYNRFVTLRNRSLNAWSQVDVQLRRRYDLIPNFVATVKGYASHESEVFQRVTEARAMGVAAKTVNEQAQAENMITAAMRQLMVVAEAYPELKASQNFRDLQAELATTENKIAVARQIYNDTVLIYNNSIQTFPGAALAGPFGFAPRDYLEIEEVAKAAPTVDFNAPPDVQAPAGESPPAGA